MYTYPSLSPYSSVLIYYYMHQEFFIPHKGLTLDSKVIRIPAEPAPISMVYPAEFNFFFFFFYFSWLGMCFLNHTENTKQSENITKYQTQNFVFFSSDVHFLEELCNWFTRQGFDSRVI